MVTTETSELSSTYQSFNDVVPSYSYLDLNRARSDESLLWSASEEAAVLVAELRASLPQHSTASVIRDTASRNSSLRHSTTAMDQHEIQSHRTISTPVQSYHQQQVVLYPGRSKSFTNLTSTSSVESLEHCTSENGGSGIRLSSGGAKFLKDYSRCSLRPRKKVGGNNTDGYLPPHYPNKPKSENIRSFGSWRSLLKCRFL